MLKQFRKTNACEQATELSIRMASFSFLVTPSGSKNNAKRFVDVCLFPTLRTGKGEATFNEWRERAEFTPRKKVGNFHVSQQLLSMIVDKLNRRAACIIEGRSIGADELKSTLGWPNVQARKKLSQMRFSP